jgi:hypothetical protein
MKKMVKIVLFLLGLAMGFFAQAQNGQIKGRIPDNDNQSLPGAAIILTGTNVLCDQGEARFGNIRGTAPSLNSVSINGERVPSAEAEIRP